MKVGQTYRCTNRSCNCEIAVSISSDAGGKAKPRCCCGSDMKMSYSKPVVRELSGSDADRERALFNQD